MSRDPEDGRPTDPRTFHRYLYSGGDPVNAIDPTGRELFESALIRGGSAVTTTEAAVTFTGGVISQAAEVAVGSFIEQVELADTVCTLIRSVRGCDFS